jgi:hypothetical protein
MTLGQGIGGVFGAIAGGALAVMNPALGMAWYSAAAIGFTLGSGIGSYFDPVAADSNAPGGPNDKIDVTTTEEGSPIPDLLGMSKVSGNIIGFWNPRTEEVREGGKGGKGGSSKKGGQVTGYKFFLTWAVVLCEGPVDEIYAIYVDSTTCVWKGNVTRSSASYETIVIDSIGTCRIYWGTSTQNNDTKMDSFLTDPTSNPAYRNWCYVIFDDCCVGPQGRMPSINFVIRKTPTVFGSDALEVYDINPSSAIYYILNQKLGMDSSLFDTASFATSFSTLADESFGIDILFDQYQAAISYLESILAHIDGLLTFQADGTFHLDILREDVLVENMPVITEDYMLEPMVFKRRSWLTTVNEMKIQYPLRIYTDDDDVEPLAMFGIDICGECGTYQFSVSGGDPPYTWSISGGNATIDQNGLVTVTGSGDFTVTCTDGTGQTTSM